MEIVFENCVKLDLGLWKLAIQKIQICATVAQLLQLLYLTDDYLLLNFDLYETLKSVCTNLSNVQKSISMCIAVCKRKRHFQQEPPFENGVLVPSHQNKQEQNVKARCLHICGTNRCLEQVSKYKFQANFAPFSSKNS
ncbi:hypothetical protein T06_10345 [Trichinella sp. T6]|nr:hypothetical protein T06_10345 [Trichinella sp. T6]